MTNLFELLTLFLAGFFRLFGLFWMFGGILSFQKARESHLMDTVLESLSQKPEDRLVSRFLWICSPLTFLSGLGLLLVSRWVLIPLGFLVASQIIYFILKDQRLQLAQTEEEQEDHRVTPATRNAFKVSLGVVALAIAGESLGILR